MWRPLLTAAKLSRHTVRDLRHTNGTLLAERVTLPHYVTAQLGHHDVSFTMRQYVHLRSGYANQTACLDDPTLPFAQSAPISAPTGENGTDSAGGENGKALILKAFFIFAACRLRPVFARRCRNRCKLCERQRRVIKACRLVLVSALQVDVLPHGEAYVVVPKLCRHVMWQGDLLGEQRAVGVA